MEKIISKLKDQTNIYVRDGKIGKAFDLVWDYLKPGTNLNADLSLLSGQLKTLERRYHKGLLDAEMYHRQLFQITDGFTQFIQHIQLEDLLAERDGNKIQTPILVLTPTAETAAAMEAFFPFDYFKDAEFDYSDTSYQELAKEENLIIFDIYGHKGVPVTENQITAHREKLTWLLENTDRLIVWFGGHDKVVLDNAERIYAAGFRFSLYARIKEMLDYLTYYTPKSK
jgi:hypothetical protein